jgi:large subunit ribosomal protein L9
MKVLLNETLKNVGRAGEIKEVKDGYARNYLIPRGLATMATAGTVKQAEARHQAEERREAKNATANQALGQKVAGARVTLRARVGENDRLYGAITATDIATALTAEVGQEIDRRRVELEDPIRRLGEYKVPVRLARDIVPEVTVVVEKDA